jgi:UDP-N-acetylmuramate dehydrogenase
MRNSRGARRGLDKRVRGVVKFNEKLSLHSSLRVGGEARYFVRPQAVEDIKECLSFAQEEDLPWVAMGNGTNILFPDEGYPGVVIQVGPGMKGKELDHSRGILRVQAGESLGELIHFLHSHGLNDFDFLVGIPGAVGGSLVMNAGIPEGAIGDLVKRVYAIDERGEEVAFTKEECEFGYRESRFQRERLVIFGAEFAVGNHREWDLEELRARRRRQPLGQPSPGCVFRNPPGDYAGRLIERAGLKGFRIGGAAISTVHANFIVNEGGARAADVLRLIELVRERVYKEFGVELEMELEVISN